MHICLTLVTLGQILLHATVHNATANYRSISIIYNFLQNLVHFKAVHSQIRHVLCNKLVQRGDTDWTIKRLLVPVQARNYIHCITLLICTEITPWWRYTCTCNYKYILRSAVNPGQTCVKVQKHSLHLLEEAIPVCVLSGIHTTTTNHQDPMYMYMYIRFLPAFEVLVPHMGPCTMCVVAYLNQNKR